MSLDDFEDLEVPSFLRRAKEEAPADWSNHPLRAAAEAQRAAMHSRADRPWRPAIDPNSEAGRQKRIRDQNRIARMLIKKEDHSNHTWNFKLGVWVDKATGQPVETKRPKPKEQTVSIESAQPTYHRADSARIAARRRFGDTPFVIEEIADGCFTFKKETASMDAVNKPAPTGRNAKTDKIAKGPTGIQRQYDPEKRYTVKSNARRDAKRFGLDPKLAVVKDGSLYKIVAADKGPGDAEVAATDALKAKAPQAAKGKPERKAKAPAAPKAPRKRAAARAGAGTADKGTKLSLIVAMLKRPEGCTTKDVLEATGWPSVSMPQQAKSAGLTLKKEKVKGSPTIYRAE